MLKCRTEISPNVIHRQSSVIKSWEQATLYRWVTWLAIEITFASKLNRDQVLIHTYIVLASSRHGFNEWRRRNTLLYYNTACCSCNIRFWAGPASKIRRTNNNRHNNNGMMNSLGILLFTLCMYILCMYNVSFMKKLKSKLWTLLSIKWRNTPINWSITQLLVVDSIVYFHMPCKLQV